MGNFVLVVILNLHGGYFNEDKMIELLLADEHEPS